METYAKIVLGNVTGLPRDACINDLAFDAADLAPATLNGIGDSIASFYNDANTNVPLSQYLGDQLSRVANACSVEFYNVSAHLDGSPAGSPVHTYPWTLGGGGVVNDYPSEVALRLTFYADGWETVPEQAPNPAPPPATIRPRARYRGGIYLGPLSTSCAVQALGTSEPRPKAAFIQDLDDAAFRFMDERGGDFCVWSRADAVFRPVAPGGMWQTDDAFDTIRKRGQAAITRSTIWP